MPTVALAAVLTLLLAGPAAAVGGNDNQPAEYGFPIVMLVLIVVSVVFALVWRAVMKRKQHSDR